MIEETLFKVNQLGKDGFIWWIGQVAPCDSWKNDSSINNFQDDVKKAKNWPERCKVRIIGYHTFRKTDLPDVDLPWAHILIDPSLGSGQGGEGMTSNLTGGETCFGFFLDGDDAQQPVIVGLLHRHRMVQNSPIDDDFAFQPFTGHPDSNIAPTKRIATPSSPPKEAPSPPSPNSVTPIDSNTPIPNTSTVTYKDGFWTNNSNIIPTNNDIDSNFVGFGSTSLISQSLVGFGTTFTFLDPNSLTNRAYLFTTNFGDSIWTYNENFATLAFLKSVTISYTPPSDCHNNTIGQITQILQDFIGITNGIQKFAGVYIDPILNEVVDITNSIKSTANSIGGIIRLIINSIRSGLIKCILSLFTKFIGLENLCDITQTIFSISVKNILDIIFCLFEKIIPGIISFIEQLLTDMVDSVFTAPICAIEQWVSGILVNLMNTIEEVITPITSGIEWLTGGLSNIYSVLNSASTLAAQIYSFIGCDSLKCTTPSKWVSTIGPSEIQEDDWNRMVNNINVVSGIASGLGSIESAIAGSSFYGQAFDYNNCNQAVNNPTSQDDLPLLFPGTKLKTCIPPKISIIGDGMGAKLEPRISTKGEILSVDILSPGFGYTRTPSLTVIDNSGYGNGAILSAILEKGSIKKIVIKNPGIGYCKPKKNKITGIGSTSSDSFDDMTDVCLDDNLDYNGPQDTNFTLSLETNNKSVYEGDSFTISITSNNKVSPKRVSYEIEGVTKTDIKQNLKGTLNLDNGKAKIKIDTIPNNRIDYKILKFKLKNYNKSISIIINDISNAPLNKDYILKTKSLNINEGSSFTIELITKDLEDGTVIPFKISGVSDNLIQNQELYSSFSVVNNKSKLKFNTNKGIIQNDQLFKLELNNKQASIGILINSITPFEPDIESVACITELVVIRPGIGYNITDTATDGVNTYELIISPENGAIFGVRPLIQYVCGFTNFPKITINTNTGVGAEILPIMVTDNNSSGTITNLNQIGTEPIKITDCI